MATIDLNHETICINPTDDLTLYDKNNIMSRIEKFLFAICSLDSSDLPVPLSRIEELYYCLVTGDTPPTFEPLSRAEKFLMACLGVYDINKLPEPLSRSEVLLKKIAIGDNNLEDVDNLQSKYEFLLAYIIQNGGIGDFDEYVLNTQFSTLYNTKEKPVKSAILKGNTMVNLLTQNSSNTRYATRTQIDRGYRYTQQYDESMSATRIEWSEANNGHSRLKPNTKYYVQFTVKANKGRKVRVTFEDGSQYATILAENSTTTVKCSVRCGESLKRFFVYIYPLVNDESYTGDTFDILDFMTIEYQEGMENWDIPYFEGMKSVKMPVLTTTGKNLFDSNNRVIEASSLYGYIDFTDYDGTLTFSIRDKDTSIDMSGIFFGATYQGRNYDSTTENNGGWLFANGSLARFSITTSMCKYFSFYPNNQETLDKIIARYDIQIEESSQPTEYEPHKSNILTFGKTFTQSMFEQGSFRESTPHDTKSYEDIKIDPSNPSNGSYHSIRIRTKTTHKVIPGASYNVKINDGYGIFICFCKNGLYSEMFNNGWSTFYNFAFTVPTDCDEMFFALRKIDNSDITVEDYPAIGLEIRQEVTLRGIGEVKDELNCLTGELTQRVGEINTASMNTSYFIGYAFEPSGLYRMAINIENLNINGSIKCDKLPVVPFMDSWNLPYECIAIYSGGILLYLKDTPTVESFINKATGLDLIIQYELTTASVKTVDLSVVDQDENDTKLSTFNDITHVTLSSEGLIPEAELEVATKNEEDLEDSSVYTVHTLSEEFNTLYNTEEKPVKSAISKGQTLVNLFNTKNIKQRNVENSSAVAGYDVATGTVHYLTNIEATTSYNYSYVSALELGSEGCAVNTLKPNTTYTVKWFYEKIKDTDPSKTVMRIGLSKNVWGSFSSSYLTQNPNIQDGICVFTTPSEFPQDMTKSLSLGIINASNTIEYKVRYVVLEGDHTNVNIPYFEGMKSVKMPVLTTTGKNLFDINSMSNINNWDTVVSSEIPYCSYKINLKPNTTYTFSQKQFVCAENVYASFGLEKGGFEYLLAIAHPTTHHKTTFTLTTDDRGLIYVKLYKADTTLETFISKLSNNQVQLEESSTATLYEPHKSNILTCNEEVELRGGIGTTKDELNLLTGELTQRIGEIVVDGSESWSLTTDWPSDSAGSFEVYKGINDTWDNYNSNGMTINNIGLNSEHYLDVKQRRTSDFGIGMGHGKIIISVPFSKLSEPNTNGFKTWLASNPITIQYRLATESVKTVDLSVVDQDENDTKLSTFNDITHVTLSSEGLIPEAELEVAEKVPEIAASILTISREQEVIDSATNKQSENVDATMIATTEIYEGLL